MLSGASVRYRFYTRWGVTAEELSRIVFSYSVTFWLGLLALGGLSLATSPLPDGARLPANKLLTLVGWLLMLVAASSTCWRSPSPDAAALRSFELPLPSPRLRRRSSLISAGRVGAGRRRAVRAAAAERPVVSSVSRHLPDRDPARDGESRARRRRRVRRTDGPAAEAVPDFTPAAASAGRVSASSITCCR